ncbi:hypothetical protein N0V88_005765 [Collariella sp. IMI 366227]|nr:hypothetical protein N0V88_005765 [Collariella sp. IMI 366227]
MEFSAQTTAEMGLEIADFGAELRAKSKVLRDAVLALLPANEAAAMRVMPVWGLDKALSHLIDAVAAQPAMQLSPEVCPGLFRLLEYA